MASVVFMRGVNVGGRKAFRPAALANELSAFDVVNVGAAGTYVVRGSIGQRALRAEVRRRLPVEADLMICRARDVLELASGNPFPRGASAEGVRRFVSVLARRPRTSPKFPLRHPAGREWQVTLVGLQGKFVLSLWRRRGRTLVYPNQVVEKSLGVAATTRNWTTICKIRDMLRDG